MKPITTIPRDEHDADGIRQADEAIVDITEQSGQHGNDCKSVVELHRR